MIDGPHGVVCHTIGEHANQIIRKVLKGRIRVALTRSPNLREADWMGDDGEVVRGYILCNGLEEGADLVPIDKLIQCA